MQHIYAEFGGVIYAEFGGVTRATIFGTKIAINAYKCISMKDSEARI